MSYQGEWRNTDGTPATGFTIDGWTKPGRTYTLTRRLHNTGDEAFDLETELKTGAPEGVSASVNDTVLTPGVPMTVTLEPGEFAEITCSRAVPLDDDPGAWQADLIFRAMS